jgi:hypothetical protein
MSSTTRCRPWIEPGAVSATPTPMAMEQADPGGRQLHDAERLAVAEVEIDVEAGLAGVEGFRAVRVRYGDWHQLELEAQAHRPFWVWPEPARDLPVCCAAAR